MVEKDLKITLVEVVKKKMLIKELKKSNFGYDRISENNTCA